MDDFFVIKSSDLSIHFVYTQKPEQSSFTMHTHEEYELYYFVSGCGTFVVEGNEYKLESGDIIILNCSEAHYFRIDDDSVPYIRMTINFTHKLFSELDRNNELFKAFDNREKGQMNRYKAIEFESPYHRVLMNNLITNVENKRLQTTANLLLLLYEISVAFEKKDVLPLQSTLGGDIIKYINNHLLELITLDDLCREFHISKTHLCRVFKNATGTTVNNYIITKRLIHANELIGVGIKPMKAYLLSGFNNYTVFYKAYKKRYQVSPSVQCAQGKSAVPAAAHGD